MSRIRSTRILAIPGLVAVFGLAGGISPAWGNAPGPADAPPAQVLQTSPPQGPGQGPPASSAVPAQKRDLTRQNRDCTGLAIDPVQTQGFGFSVVRRTGSNMIVTTAVVRGATPNATYRIRVIQAGPTLGNSDCQEVAGTVTTDEYGNGEANVREDVLPGANHVFVVLNNTADPNGDYFTSEPVALVR